MRVCMTSVYHDTKIDMVCREAPFGLFADLVGEYSRSKTFLTEELFDKMNDAIDGTYKNNREIAYLPFKWYAVSDDKLAQDQFIYFFFEKMGNEPKDDEVFSATYTSNVVENEDWLIEQDYHN